MGSQRSCIYRVPNPLREIKPEAYTPQMVLIGPLHRTRHPHNPRMFYLDEESNSPYRMMEEKKMTYLESFTKRFGEETIKHLLEKIKSEENSIRGSYDESTEWIPSEAFVDLIFLDSVFIMEFSIKLNEISRTSGDQIVDNDYTRSRVIKDLILLENQLPYFIFEIIFGSIVKLLCLQDYAARVVLDFFSLKIKTKTTFKHFTDMFRCVYEESLDQRPKLIGGFRGSPIKEMPNAANLSRAGVEFKTLDQLISAKSDPLPLDSISIRQEGENYSLHVAFNKGCLMMSSFRVDKDIDIILRNVIAYEQCHVALTPVTSNYIHFLNFLITTKRDVEVLRAEGVLTHSMGSPSLVVEMVNKLTVGLNISATSQYHSIAMNLTAHYKSRRKRCWATLNKVYFSDMLTGTASTAAILLLFLTLVGTVASVLQAYKSFNPTRP